MSGAASERGLIPIITLSVFTPGLGTKPFIIIGLSTQDLHNQKEYTSHYKILNLVYGKY